MIDDDNNKEVVDPPDRLFRERARQNVNHNQEEMVINANDYCRTSPITLI